MTSDTQQQARYEDPEHRLNRLIALRRHLHTHPELSGEERKTARFVAYHLRRAGLQVEEGVGGTGVVGLLAGDHPGPTIAYRADMDALPIQDTLGRPYAPLPLGVKHACGHDLHMAIALGIAEWLSETHDRLHGQVVFVFQPAEESLDGARAMLADGLLPRYRPEAILALHAFPLQVGSIGVAMGHCLAGMEEFRVRFYAPAGDLKTIMRDAIAALEALSTSVAPQTADEFQALIDDMVRKQEAGGDRGTDPTRATFLKCWPATPGADPPYDLLGLVSIADFAIRPEVQQRIRETLDRVVANHGASYDLMVTFSNPPLQNHPGLVKAIMPMVEGMLGPENVLRFRTPYPFAHEDLALYAAEVPTALIWLGTANAEDNLSSILHTPDYDVDERALEIGARLVREIILRWLGETPFPSLDPPTGTSPDDQLISAGTEPPDC